MVTTKSFTCQDGIVHATLQGEVNNGVWSDFFRRTLAISAVHRTRALLIDLRSARIPVDAFEVHQLPPALEYIGLNRMYGIALLMKERTKELDFYEVVFLNQGFQAKVFTEFDEAKTWLVQECPVN